MWLLMAVEQPLIAAVVARMSEATRQLAAFGVTFSLALFIEGPVIQMLAAGTAAADSRENYRRLAAMMHLIGWSATAVHALLCLPAVFGPFARGVMGMPEELLEPARRALVAMLPWTLAVGFRRLWQGVLIRYGRTVVIPFTMVARIAVSLITLIWGLITEAVPGAVLGGLALSAGVIAGAVASRIAVHRVLAELPDDAESTPPPMRWSALALFYIPLALTNFINLGARPLMQVGLARGPLPLESLALWPVSMGYLFLYTSFSLSSQEVVIARLEDEASRRTLTRFSLGLGAVLGGLYALVLLTPLWRLWFSRVSGLSGPLLALAPQAVALALPVVPLAALISLYRGALVRLRRTGEVTAGIAVNVAVLMALLFTGVRVLPIPAISTVSAAYALAFVAETIFLASRRPLKPFRGTADTDEAKADPIR